MTRTQLTSEPSVGPGFFCCKAWRHLPRSWPDKVVCWARKPGRCWMNIDICFWARFFRSIWECQGYPKKKCFTGIPHQAITCCRGLPLMCDLTVNVCMANLDALIKKTLWWNVHLMGKWCFATSPHQCVGSMELYHCINLSWSMRYRPQTGRCLQVEVRSRSNG